MDKNKQMELFHYSFVNAIAAQVGLTTSIPNVDDDSIDLTIRGKGDFGGAFRSPQIDIQLKSTTYNREMSENQTLKFPLKLKNYNDLRGHDFTAPRYLFLLLVPQECDHWIKHFSSLLLLRRTCYWVNLADHGETKNTQSVTIEIPLRQRLTHHSLHNIMKAAANGVIYK